MSPKLVITRPKNTLALGAAAMTDSLHPIVARLGRGLGAHGFMQAVQLFIRLAEVPLFLTFWGAAGYGEWLMIAALPSVLALSDGGVTKAAQREMAMYAGRADHAGVLRIFQSAWAMLMVLSVAVIGLMALVLPMLPIYEWMHLKIVDANTLVLTLLLLAAQVLVYFQCGLLYGGFASVGTYATGTLYQVLAFLLGFLGLGAGVVIGRSTHAAATGALIGQTIGFLIMRLALANGVPGLRYGFRQASWLEMKRLSLPSVANLAFPIGEALNIQGMRLILGTMLGPIALATFSTLRTLSRMALQPVMSIARTIEPEISLAYGAADSGRMRQLLLKGSQAGLWMSIGLCLFMGLAGSWFFDLWVNKTLIFDRPLFALLLMVAFINSLWGISLTVPCATNRHLGIALWFSIIYGGGVLCLTGVLTHWLGLSGAGVALLVGEFCLMCIVVPVACRLVDKPIKTWTTIIIRPPAYLFAHISRLLRRR